MNTKLKKIKDAAKRHAPVIITTASVTAIVVIAYYQRKNGHWHALVLNQETRDAMAKSDDVTVAFDELKVFVTGKPWNPGN